MNVLYPLRYFPTLTETFVYREIAGVLAAGDRVCIAALGSREDGADNDAVPDVPVLRVPRRPLVGRLAARTRGQAFLAAHQRAKDAARLPWLAQRVQAQGIEHAHVHFAGEAAEVAHALHLDLGLPYSVMVHAVDLFKPRPSLGEVLGAACDVTVVAAHHLDALPPGIGARVVHCGVDLDAWSMAPPPDGPLRALFVGRDVPKKGLDTLLDAWGRLELPGASLTLVGPSPRSLPHGVRALGPQPGARVRAELEAANLVVLPCRRAPDGDMDGIPVVLMEALAAGRPVVTTPVSGIPELVDPQVGWLVPPDAPAALADALSAADPAARMARGARGPERLRERAFTLGDQVTGARAAWCRRPPPAAVG